MSQNSTQDERIRRAREGSQRQRDVEALAKARENAPSQEELRSKALTLSRESGVPYNYIFSAAQALAMNGAELTKELVLSSARRRHQQVRRTCIGQLVRQGFTQEAAEREIDQADRQR